MTALEKLQKLERAQIIVNLGGNEEKCTATIKVETFEALEDGGTRTIKSISTQVLGKGITKVKNQAYKEAAALLGL